MADHIASGNLSSGTPLPAGPVFDQRMARVSALAALATLLAAIVYSRQAGFAVYGVLFAIPYIIFVLARSGRKWQAWGAALAWVVIALALFPATFITIRIIRPAHRSDLAMLVFLFALMLTQAAQLIFVRRSFAGIIAVGKPLFRSVLYYVCVLLVVAATLPNWYVPPAVRHENSAVQSLQKYSAALDSYATRSQTGGYPSKLSALAATAIDSELTCARSSCIKNGYRFEYHPVFKDKHVVSYTVSARPAEFEETGALSFLLTAEGKIYQTREDRDARPTDASR